MIPALETAVTALDSLNQKDVAEIRVYVRPPSLVIKVMNAVQTLLGIARPDWATAKLMLGDGQFFHQLIHIDKENIPEKVTSRPTLEAHIYSYLLASELSAFVCVIPGVPEVEAVHDRPRLQPRADVKGVSVV